MSMGITLIELDNQEEIPDEYSESRYFENLG